MIIQCQGCAAKYFLAEEKVPEKSLKVSCPKCKAVFTLVPHREPVAAAVTPAAQPASESTPAPAQQPAPVTEASEGASTTPPSRPKRGSKEDRAKRLARVLVSDILCYNQEKRDQALADGNLMTVLGEEIKKSWELYKEKVGPEMASSTNYFKEALNDILADGQEVF